jgi:cob(I)alamin adenosyltransferase
MKIYTKTGDAGETGLFGGPRVRKDDVRIEAYGTVDELNAAIGLARTEPLPNPIAEVLQTVQHDLFAVGAELATPSAAARGTQMAEAAATTALEEAIDALESRLPPLKCFILPAGSRAASLLHLARCICRRAERRVVTLQRSSAAGEFASIIRYLNRLSDYLFVAARAANQAGGHGDVPWVKGDGH